MILKTHFKMADLTKIAICLLPLILLWLYRLTHEKLEYMLVKLFRFYSTRQVKPLFHFVSEKTSLCTWGKN